MRRSRSTASPEGNPVELGPELVAEFLGSTRAFHGADPGIMTKLARHVECREYPAGAAVFRAGGAASHLGFLFSGKVTVRLVNAVSGEYKLQQELRVGDHFGEVAILLDSAQPYELVAEAPSTVLLVPAKVFGQLTQLVSALPLALARSVASRLVRAAVSDLSGAAVTRKSTPGTVPPPEPAAALPEGALLFVRTANYDITEQLVRMVPVETMLQNRFLPLELKGNTLTVGMVDPTNIGAKNDLERILHGIELNILAISNDDYMSTLVRLRLDTGQHKRDSTHGAQLAFEKEDGEKEVDSALGVIGKEVVAMVNKILSEGIERGASDIHIEEQRADMRVRFRINGMLQDWNEYIPSSFGKSLVARIKVLAGLDITERRRPQDGRVGLKVGRRDVDFRVSTVPASRGEKVVMRLFEASNMMRPLEQIFYEKDTLMAVRDVLSRPYGAIIVAGATGSGKSSTLYACLGERMTTRPDTNICVVEDPIEYRLKGVTQVQVNHSIDLTFASVLRAFLRQDPDVIMVGEMRDTVTAHIALEAAMTGHVVLSSFHANNVTAAVQRLENFGCNRTMIAQAVSLIVVQRLVRRLCPHCAIMTPAQPLLARSLADRGLIESGSQPNLPKPAGCDKCDRSGYSGRVPVIEAIKVTDDIAAELMAGGRLDEIEKKAVKDRNMIPFRRYASFLMARKVIAPGEALLAVAK